MLAAGSATNTEKYSVIPTANGLLAAGSATNTEKYSFVATAAGVRVYGNYAERDIPDLRRFAPRPAILFEVSLYTLTNTYSYPQPDAISNLVRIREETKVDIPGVAEGLEHGDQFTLYGSYAYEIRDAYSSVLTVISTT